MRYNVTATSLNLRNGPALTSAIIGSLSNGLVVDSIDPNEAENPDWLKVSAIVNGATLQGFVASRYLRVISTPAPAEQQNPHQVPEVNYSSPESKRGSVNARHAKLGEADMPQRNIGASATPDTKKTDIYKIVDYLDVVNSVRYQPIPQPTPKTTYCNIYAYDFCYLAQAYLPRVWWMSKALMDFAKTPVGTPPVVPTLAYGKNVAELNVNALYDWLDEWGDDFGWVRTYDLTDLQNKVNDGRISLHHDDVLALTEALLPSERFQAILAGKYPFIFVDEYQDTNSDIMDAIKAHLMGRKGGPLIGLFGDHWQRIYDGTCGYVSHDDLTEIGKKANFRSAASVVSVLNKMRPTLPQAVKDDAAVGSAVAYHTNSWVGHTMIESHHRCRPINPDTSVP